MREDILMGLFDIFRPKINNNQKFLINNPYIGKYDEKRIGLDNVIYLLYCDYSDAEKWIKDAKKANIYFSNFDKAVQILAVLSSYEKRFRFKKPYPSEQLNTLLEKYTHYTQNFVINYWNSNLKFALLLKTENGRKKRIQRFFDEMSTYSDRLNPELNRYIDQLKDNPQVQNNIFSTNIKVGNHILNSIVDINTLDSHNIALAREMQKAATEFKRMEKMDLAIACLRKSNEISDYAEIPILTEKEYLRLINYVQLAKGKELADAESKIIYTRHPEFLDRRISNLEGIHNTITQCRKLKRDLVIVNTHSSCPICGKYNKKIYSLSGKNKRYPKLPSEIINSGGFCPNCFLGLNIYFEGLK